MGAAGQMLDTMLAAAGFSRENNVYMTNLVPWRPLGNRTPDPAVIAMCLPFVKRHIALAAPKALLLVGGLSAKSLMATDQGITRLRGKWSDITIEDKVYPALPMFHPTYLQGQPNLKGHAWRDLLAMRAHLAGTV